jgi:hypothetical protein
VPGVDSGGRRRNSAVRWRDDAYRRRHAGIMRLSVHCRYDCGRGS